MLGCIGVGKLYIHTLNAKNAMEWVRFGSVSELNGRKSVNGTHLLLPLESCTNMCLIPYMPMKCANELRWAIYPGIGNFGT